MIGIRKWNKYNGKSLWCFFEWTWLIIYCWKTKMNVENFSNSSFKLTIFKYLLYATKVSNKFFFSSCRIQCFCLELKFLDCESIFDTIIYETLIKKGLTRQNKALISRRKHLCEKKLFDKIAVLLITLTTEYIYQSFHWHFNTE